MGILGLTHSKNGTALEKLPVTIKVAIGEGPEPGPGNERPRQLDHFVFKQKTLRGEGVVWTPSLEITQVYGEKPTELGIIFLNDDPREVLRTEYALWTPSECKCHGNLVQIENGDIPRFEMQATRRTQKHPEGEVWPGRYEYVEGPKKGQPMEPCGDGCPDLRCGDCRPSGDLYFILEKFPIFGTICRLHTSSYRSVRNLSNGLMQIRQLNGGHLIGAKAILKVSPERISYCDNSGTWHASVAYILSLEIRVAELRRFVTNAGNPARVFEEGRAPFEIPRGIQYVACERDSERADEISREFYPKGQRNPDDPGESSADRSEESEQLARICELAANLGYSDAETKMLVGRWRRDFGGLERRLRNEVDEGPQEYPLRAYNRKRRGRSSGSGSSPRKTAAASNRTAGCPSPEP